ncbi:glycoside hydrolase family 32 protein [Aegicerativicinus sediminis]|uniref:glycoside hydrolase family 32 protein n=1 Tax=Aegicerativicinus sediminis TaxID=2893202 RepID=UPI001E5E5008|nr:glycoside hydrolase family 32 protein [Aegicerativicinus sediminis]
MLYRSLAIFLWLTIFLSCRQETGNIESLKEPSLDSLDYNEKFRPQFHFSPPTHWMNDPNGLVYNNGYYHLFYQYYPEDIVWGPMHWGHARSKDLLHWENRAIALYPDSLGYIFSGSAVVDKTNSTGFGTNENPPLVAMYTYHLDKGAKAGRHDFQTQGIAYSLDNGETWTKFEGNPVVPNSGIHDFRDPKVFWHEEMQKWVLILVAGDHAIFYQSDNLKNWQETGRFGKNAGAHGGVWECPDLFKLPVSNSDEAKWVLLISINPGGPNQGSATQYFIGDFDGKTFTPEHNDIRWVDFGRDNYAGITYNNEPNNERIFIGWMSNWDYGQQTPTTTWRSSMTVPRELSLEKIGEHVYLKNYPVSQFQTLTAEEKVVLTSVQDSIISFERSDFEGVEISFQLNLDGDSEIALGTENYKTIFGFKKETNEFYVDRSNSGQIDFADNFANPLITSPNITDKNNVKLKILVDRASIELFIDGGLVVLTNQVFPSSIYDQFFITEGIDAIENLKISTIKSVWHEE